jgi:NAD-dependent dihydropyrimidine dehydrogenase PreA subunit
MKSIAEELRQHHCMFASSKTFEKVYILELAYWNEGMPFKHYQKFLSKYGIHHFQEHVITTPDVIKKFQKDIPDLGVKGLKIIGDIGLKKQIAFDGCIGCGVCVEECPEKSLNMDTFNSSCSITLDLSLCDGVACRRCERVCSENVFDLIALITSSEQCLPLCRRQGTDVSIHFG